MPLIVLAILFCSSDTVLFGTNKQISMQKAGQILDMAFIAVLPVLSVLFNKPFAIKRKELNYAVIMIMCILVSSLFNMDLRGGVYFKIALVILCLEMSALMPFKDFCIIITKFVVFFAWCSVILYVLFRIVPDAALIGVPLSNSADWNFRHFLVYVQEDLPPVYIRNYGIYREPGVYQMFLIAAMLVLIRLWDWKKKFTVFSMAGLLIALWTTKSTTGYFAFIIFAVYVFSYKGLFRQYKKARILCAALILLLLVMVFLFPLTSDDIAFWMKDFLRKFDRTNSGYYSFYARYSSITINLLLWLRNPLFGMGLTNHDEYFDQTAIEVYGMSNNCNTNTILAQFGAFGIIMGIIWILAIWKMSVRLGRNRIQKCSVFLLFVILFMCENVNFSPVWNIFMFYAVTMQRDHQCKII